MLVAAQGLVLSSGALASRIGWAAELQPMVCGIDSRITGKVCDRLMCG
ncbi:hypothetical protein HMPREF0297_0479 [Corynebacterium jeikeium ATCC 43734]|nr:hypothetical protein HMPREF0297_0479 [Corynebacterium jeikeium ATCC 43734]